MGMDTMSFISRRILYSFSLVFIRSNCHPILVNSNSLFLEEIMKNSVLRGAILYTPYAHYNI